MSYKNIYREFATSQRYLYDTYRVIGHDAYFNMTVPQILNRHLEIIENRNRKFVLKFTLKPHQFKIGEYIFNKICNEKELEKESSEMKHCVRGFGRMIANKNYLAYSATSDTAPRITVGINVHEDRKSISLDQYQGVVIQTLSGRINQNF